MSTSEILARAKESASDPARAREARPLAYQPGFGNQFVSEALPDALPVGRNSPQRPPYGLYAELISATVLHRPARREPAHLDLPHPPVGGAPALCADRQRPDPQRARSTRSTRRPRSCAGARSRSRKAPTDFVDGICTIGGNGDVATQIRHGGAHLCGQQVDDRPLFLQCRRRDADRAAAGARALRHRARRHRGRARRDRAPAARPALPRRTAGRPLARLYLRELRRRAAAARNSARSAPTGSPIRATSSRRSPPSRTRRSPARWSPNSRAICGPPT